MEQSEHPDWALITALGGPTKVAEALGYDKETGGVQRVQNWKTRGIPPAVKLERPDLFLPQFQQRRDSTRKPVGQFAQQPAAKKAFGPKDDGFDPTTSIDNSSKG